MKTLKLFNAVIRKESDEQPYVSTDGYIIESGALWDKERIIDYYRQEALSGHDLNKTFHKSWKKVIKSTRAELALEQIFHYLSTYGTNFQGEIYIPGEVLKVPDTKIVFKVIRSYTKDEMRDKCLGLLKSGVAFAEETVDDVLSVLTDELDYQFTGEEGVRNKEAIVKIADLYGVVPQDIMGFMRYIVYRSTDSTLLIKNKETVEAIKNSSYNPSVQFQQFGLERLAECFNRFKPLFLAYKSKCPRTINRIAKLSKTHHKPMVANPLNLATHRELTDADRHWLDNATPYALFKALSACWSRDNGQDTFAYKIRNGKSWVAKSKPGSVSGSNKQFILEYLKGRCSLTGKKVYIPEDIVFALPTSEKMFVGNIPAGTKFSGKKLAVGIYWENKWGAHDLDLSAQNLDGKVGWNAAYSQDGNLVYSGDITNAPNGAVEYLYARKGLKHPSLVRVNVFSGDEKSGYKIIVGRGDGVSKKYMMNPNNLFMEARCSSVQKQMILGIIIPENKKGSRQSFVIMNMGAGHARVSGGSKISDLAREALFQQWKSPVSFNQLAAELGAEFVDDREAADVDLSLDSLEKDTFIKLFQ